MSDLAETSPLLKSKLPADASLLSVGIVVLFLDQLTKAVFFGDTLPLNKGISLGLGVGMPHRLLTLLLVIFVLLLAKVFKKTWLKYPVAGGLLLGGAIGNILDRIWWGGVRDWWTVPVWGVKNNLADWAVFIGVFILIFQLLSSRELKSSKF